MFLIILKASLCIVVAFCFIASGMIYERYEDRTYTDVLTIVIGILSLAAVAAL